jgi:hypothetical protein
VAILINLAGQFGFEMTSELGMLPIFEESRSQIEVQNHLIDYFRRAWQSGISPEQGNSHALIIGRPLIPEPVFTEERAIVPGKHNDRIVRDTECLQFVYDSADVVINS